MKKRQSILSASVVFTMLTAVACSSSQKNTYVAARAPASDQAGTSEDVVALVKSWVVDPDAQLGFVTTLEEIEKYGLQKGKAKEQPWSGSYWPDRIGGVAARYREINQKISIVKKPERNHRQFLRLHSKLEKNYDRLTREDIRNASPAEKYDLLIGDRDFNFTKSVWNEISFFNQKKPGVALWNGICDGWTSSSLAISRPRVTVTAVSPDGKVIDFYPDDLKALVSYLWGHIVLDQNPNLPDGTPKFVNYGFRCDKKRPMRDKRGTVMDLGDGLFTRDPGECRDINPGVWHLNIVNRMGIQGRGFVMDKDYDESVNNHTVAAYQYQYFNPKTGKAGGLESSTIELSDYTNDPFKSRRNPAAKYLLGVSMNVTYMDYGMPIKGHDYDNESIDKTDVMPLVYDIELSADRKILSGQWRVNRTQSKRDIRGFPKPHYPDFMWYQRALVRAPGEDLDIDSLLKHDWSQPVPAALRDSAKELTKYVIPIYTLKERASFPKVESSLKVAAGKSSDRNDEAWFAYCLAATGSQWCSPLPDSDPKSKEPKIAELKRIVDAADADLESYHTKLDQVGIPRNRPYPQLLGRIVYGLFEAARSDSLRQNQAN